MARDLGRQLASCHKLEFLHIPRQPHVAQGVIGGLGNMINITWLDLGSCDLTEEQCSVMCRQLQSLRHLERLILSENPIGSTGAKHLAASIRSWGPNPPLRKLRLYNCRIDAPCTAALMEALATCRGLEELRISGKTVSGTFQAIDPHLVYPQLGKLYMSHTSLSGEDIQGLASIVNNNGMPKLELLHIGYNKVKEIASSIRKTRDWDERAFSQIVKDEPDETLEAWRILVEKVRYVILMEGNFMSSTFGIKEIWKAEQERRLKLEDKK